MMVGKVHFSRQDDPENWEYSNHYLTVFVIPREWWSRRAWRICLAIREKTLVAVLRELNKVPGDAITFQTPLK